MNYPIGTICIGQNHVLDIKYNGMECEIIGGLEMRIGRGPTSGRIRKSLSYDVRWANGHETYQDPHTLRRKPPKQSDSQWADEAVQKLKKQSSDHVVIGNRELIPEEA